MKKTLRTRPHVLHMTVHMDECPCTDAPSAATEAGLRYVCDRGEGIKRMKKGTGFRYVDHTGTAVTDDATLKRIRSLVIPPAWTGVWICADHKGHLQATGRDAKGRKQYRYHARWREARSMTKYDRLAIFGRLLPRIRSQVEHDLKEPGLSKRKVIAAVIRLLDLTHMRVGNEEYAQENGSYGLTTLRDRHVDFEGARMRFHFRGKSGQDQDLSIEDRTLARIVHKCQELPGQELFQYIDEDGSHRPICSEDVNEYLGSLTDGAYTAKDFRTWAGTLSACLVLARMGDGDTEREKKTNIVSAIKQVAGVLGNRPATCKKYYIDPRVIRAYEEHTLGDLFPATGRSADVGKAERALLGLLGRASAPRRAKKG